jgi:hypothetical protein
MLTNLRKMCGFKGRIGDQNLPLLTPEENALAQYIKRKKERQNQLSQPAKNEEFANQEAAARQRYQQRRPARNVQGVPTRQGFDLIQLINGTVCINGQRIEPQIKVNQNRWDVKIDGISVKVLQSTLRNGYVWLKWYNCEPIFCRDNSRRYVKGIINE